MIRNFASKYTPLRAASSLARTPMSPYLIRFQMSPTTEMEATDLARWNDIFHSNPAINEVGKEIKRLVKQKGYCEKQQQQQQQPKEIFFDVFADGDVIELCQSLKQQLIGKGISVDNREFNTILGKLIFEDKSSLL